MAFGGKPDIPDRPEEERPDILAVRANRRATRRQRESLSKQLGITETILSGLEFEDTQRLRGNIDAEPTSLLGGKRRRKNGRRK